MFYNFVEYLKTEFPAENIYTNLRIKKSTEEFIPDRNLLVMETGGTESVWFNWSNPTIQIIARDADSPNARELAYDIFEKLMNPGVFGLQLPAVTVNSIVYPAVQVAQISAIQVPQNMGSDEEGRIEFSTNYIVRYRRA